MRDVSVNNTSLRNQTKCVKCCVCSLPELRPRSISLPLEEGIDWCVVFFIHLFAFCFSVPNAQQWGSAAAGQIRYRPSPLATKSFLIQLVTWSSVQRSLQAGEDCCACVCVCLHLVLSGPRTVLKRRKRRRADGEDDSNDDEVEDGAGRGGWHDEGGEDGFMNLDRQKGPRSTENSGWGRKTLCSFSLLSLLLLVWYILWQAVWKMFVPQSQGHLKSCTRWKLCPSTVVETSRVFMVQISQQTNKEVNSVSPGVIRGYFYWMNIFPTVQKTTTIRPCNLHFRPLNGLGLLFWLHNMLEITGTL